MSLNLNLTSIADIYERENFQAIQDYVNGLNAATNLKFISTQITASDSKIPHNLTFIPTDVITTRYENPGVTLVWRYKDFDNTYLYFDLHPAVASDTKYGLNILVGRLGS